MTTPRRPGPGTYARRVLVLLEQRGPQTAGDLARALRPPRRRRKPFADADERRRWHGRQRAQVASETAKVHAALARLVTLGWVAPSAHVLARGVADDIEQLGYAGAIWKGAVEARTSGDYVGHLDESHRDSALAVDALRAIAERRPLPAGAPIAWLTGQDLIEGPGLRCLVSDLPRIPQAPDAPPPLPRQARHVCRPSSRPHVAQEAAGGRLYRVTTRRCEVCGAELRRHRQDMGPAGRRGAP